MMVLDQTRTILEDFSKKDERISVIFQENSGPGVARNRGMMEATGKYLIFLDSDDWFEPVFLEKMVNLAQTTDADVTICRADEFDHHTQEVFSGEWMLKQKYLPGDSFTPKEVAPYLFQFTYGMVWDKLYKTGYVKRSKLEFPPLYNSEDLVFTFKSLLLASRISILNETLIYPLC